MSHCVDNSSIHILYACTIKYRLYTEVEVSMGFINRATQSRG